eukprot:g12829.t1
MSRFALFQFGAFLLFVWRTFTVLLQWPPQLHGGFSSAEVVLREKLRVVFIVPETHRDGFWSNMQFFLSHLIGLREVCEKAGNHFSFSYVLPSLQYSTQPHGYVEKQVGGIPFTSLIPSAWISVAQALQASPFFREVKRAFLEYHSVALESGYIALHWRRGDTYQQKGSQGQASLEEVVFSLRRALERYGVCLGGNSGDAVSLSAVSRNANGDPTAGQGQDPPVIFVSSFFATRDALALQPFFPGVKIVPVDKSTTRDFWSSKDMHRNKGL